MSDEQVTLLGLILAPVAILAIVMAVRGYHVTFKAWKPTEGHTRDEESSEGDEQ